MVPLDFDPSSYPVDKNGNGLVDRASEEFHFTFGRSRAETRWLDKRKLKFSELVSLLSTPTVGGKDGTCYTPAVFRSHRRMLDHAERIDVVVLDADCGHSAKEIEAAVRAKGWRCIIHSTYSHLSDTSRIAAKAADKWIEADPGRTIAGYMAAEKGYLPRVIENASIIEEQTEGTARYYLIKHYPCPKFRVVLPLAEPWMAENYESQDIANATWKERIGALASALGLHHDQSCSDTSRLFYLPRLRDDQQVFEFLAITEGEGEAFENCDLWSLPDAAPHEGGGMASLVPARGLRLVGGKEVPRGDHTTYSDPETGEIVDLTEWAARYASRFEIVTALRARSPERMGSRRTGVKHHLECPNSQDHFGDELDRTGTFAVNSSQEHLAKLAARKSGFVLICMHNGCKSKGHDRLDHLRALLECKALFVDDLTNPAFLAPGQAEVDTTELIQSAFDAAESVSRETSSETSLPDMVEGADPRDELLPGESPGNIPAGLYANLPGIMGEMHRWIVDTSPKYQPTLTLGAVIAFCAAAIGQRVKMQHFDTRPNVYVMAIANSGAGKDRPHTACKQMAQAADLTEKLIGVEEITSDAGIVNAVARAPHQIMLVDEASFILSATNSVNAGAHVKGVISTMLKLYSSAGTQYKSKSYAEDTKIKIIDQPCVSFYGTSVPAGLTDALSSKDVNSGLLSRLVLFDAGDRDPQIRDRLNNPIKQAEVPQEIVDWLVAWDRMPTAPNPFNMIGGKTQIDPRTIMMTAEAYAISYAFQEEMHKAKKQAKARGKDALYVRAFENCLKFALIRACASVMPERGDNGPQIDESAIRVDAATMAWAVELSRCTVLRMDTATDEIADSGFEQHLKALRQAIKRAGPRGMTVRELARMPAGRHPQKALDDLFTNLSEAGEVHWVEMNTGGRRRKAWVHKAFRDHHGIGPDDDDGGEISGDIAE